jgi:SNF2 family DNA or RNA helicase
MSVVAAFDNVFATQVQIEEEEDMADEEQQQRPLVQPPQAPQPQAQTTTTSPGAANAPLLPPPPSEYRLRLDENGEETPLGSTDEPYLDLAVPASIAKYLRPYQRTGIKFLLGNYARGRGCLLADDMGLGKTLQTVAFLSAILGKSGDPRVDSTHPQLTQFERLQHASTTTARDGSAVIDLSNDFYTPNYSIGAPALIVCPPSLIDNWSEEFNKWGTFRVIKLRSNTLDTGIAALLRGHCEVGITSYDAVRNNADKFAKVPLHVVVFDEAHKLKNPRAAQTIACARLPTRLRYALSGK